MMDFIRDAGWGIYPTLVFGALSLAVAVSYAIKPRPERLPLVVGFAIAALLAGALGTATGIQASAAYVANTPGSEPGIFLVGLRESLNNIVLALLIVTFDALLATLGAHKLAVRAQSVVRATAA